MFKKKKTQMDTHTHTRKKHVLPFCPPPPSPTKQPPVPVGSEPIRSEPQAPADEIPGDGFGPHEERRAHHGEAHLGEKKTKRPLGAVCPASLGFLITPRVVFVLLSLFVLSLINE